MRHMSCLDLRAARRNTVHVSCPCPHPREHAAIRSKQCGWVKASRGDGNYRENRREKVFRTISEVANKREKWESGNLPRLYAKCLRVWVEKFTKIWFLSLPSVLTGSLQWEPYASVQPPPISPPPHPLSLAQECVSYARWQGWTIFIQ